MKQSLQLKFSQNLALTPQLQQSIRLLQLSSQELNQELETILQENPLLERTDKNDDGSENISDFASEGFSTQDTSALVPLKKMMKAPLQAQPKTH
jgi:RNA polymerase sigma-54 factor